MKAWTKGVVVLAAALLAGAPAHAGKAKQVLAKAQLPAGFAVGSADPALGLAVEVVDGRVAATGPVPAEGANVTARSRTADGQTTLTITHRLAANLKFDLYLSADGERFEYTSSCVVTPGVASFELWEQPIRAFALGNPRAVPDGDLRCD